MALLKETRLLVELTPKHVTRSVYYKPLFPDGYAYFAKMTARQALGRFLTCTAIKVVTDDGDYYPVTRENIYDVFETVLAGKTPDDIEAVDPGVHTIASFIGVSEPDTKDSVTGLTAAQFCNIRHENLYLYGECFLKEKLTAVSEDEKCQNGYYVMLDWMENEEFTSPKVTVDGFCEDEDFAEGTVLWMGADLETISRRVIKITATDADNEDHEIFIKCKHLNMAGPAPMVEAAKSDDKTPGSGQQGGGGTPVTPPAGGGGEDTEEVTPVG